MLLIVENDVHCPAGLYAELLEDWGVPHAHWRPYAGEPAPPFFGIQAAIILGGAMGVQDVAEHPFLRVEKLFLGDCLARELPCLGICLGGQLLAEVLGAPVHSRRHGEHGCSSLSLTAAGRVDPLFAGLSDPFPSFHWHNDSFEIPAGAAHLALTLECSGQAFRYGNAWGVQFHPEVDAAIVEGWRRRIHADVAVVTDFRRQWPQLRAAGERLLGNFLHLAEMRQPFP